MLDEIYASIRDDAVFAQLPALLAAHTGQRTGAIIAISKAREMLLLAESYPEPDFGERYTANAIYEDDPWITCAFASGLIGRAVDTARFVSDAEFERSRLYQELFRPAGDDTRHCMAAIIKTEYGQFSVGLHRPAGGALDDADLRRFSGLFPHLQQMAGIKIALAAAIERAKFVEHALDDMPLGVMLVDARHQVHLANAAALTLLREGTVLHVRGGRIAARDAALDHRLAEAITLALAETPSNSTLLLLPGADGQRLALRAVPWRQGGKIYALLTLVAPAMAPAAERIQTLVALLGLTPAEARAAIHLAEGMTPSEIAQALGVGLPTVRTQIAQAKDKAGVRRTAELVQLLERINPLIG